MPTEAPPIEAPPADPSPPTLETAQTLIAAHEFDLAEKDLLELRSRKPDDAQVAVALARLHQRRGRRSESLQMYRVAAGLGTGSLDAVIGEIELLLDLGDRDRASALGEEAVSRYPGSAQVRAIHARCLAATGRLDDAVAQLVGMLEGGGISRAQERGLLFILGDLLDKLGRYEEAWTAVERANRLMEVSFDRAAAERDVEATMAAFDRAALSALPQAEPGDVRPIFLAGMPRSGKTLVEQILDRHSNVAAGGEMNLMCRAVRRIEPLTGIATAFPGCASELNAANVRALADFTGRELLSVGAGSPRVTDATPSCVFFGLIELLHPDAALVVFDRDPLDTCLSCYFKRFGRHHEYAYDLGDLGFFHRLQDRLVEHWCATLDTPIMRLRYEELVDDQERVTRELLAFCGLEWDEACLAFHESDRIVNTLSAEQVRKPMYRSAVGRHRNYEKHLAPLREA